MLRFLITVWILCLSIYTLTGCASNGDSHQPLKVQTYGTIHSGDDLVVFFPGINSSGGDFVRHGFLNPFGRRYPRADVLLVDTRMAYFNADNIASRIQQDVIIPAMKQGYRNIWFVGVSLGGLGTLIYNKAYPGNLQGIVLIAPFLGDEKVIESVSNVSSLHLLLKEYTDSEVREIRMWQYLFDYFSDSSAINSNKTKIILAYGESDRFIRSLRLLASLMPAENSFHIPGEHNWWTWKVLWMEMIERDVFNNFN